MARALKVRLQHIGLHSGPGPDGIKGKFFKLATDVTASPLAEPLNMYFVTCEVPLAWKCT